MQREEVPLYVSVCHAPKVSAARGFSCCEGRDVFQDKCLESWFDKHVNTVTDSSLFGRARNHLVGLLVLIWTSAGGKYGLSEDGRHFA